MTGVLPLNLQNRYNYLINFELQDEEPSQSQGGRKNIRKIMSSKELRFATREAEKTEEERRKRLADKQNLVCKVSKLFL